jgi:16S rRNA (uracil1498-N3)-methyltransferase
MRLHRFIGPFDFSQKTLIIDDESFVQQWRTVLRLGIGDSIILSDGHGKETEAVIIEMDKKTAEVTLGTITTPEREPVKMATLYCAMLKRENFELVVQKATEIGIARIVPIVTERTVKTGQNRDRLLKIIREAAEQSGRTVLPELAEPLRFRDAVAEAAGTPSLFFDLSGTSMDFSKNTTAYTSCFIGPEGGFSEPEVALARENSLTVASLGTLTFRGETAAIVVSYLLTHYGVPN